METTSGDNSLVIKDRETRLRTITDMKKNFRKFLCSEDDKEEQTKFQRVQSPVEDEKPKEIFSSETGICRELQVMGSTDSLDRRWKILDKLS